MGMEKRMNLDFADEGIWAEEVDSDTRLEK
jgi:hypothetical protein